MNTWFQKVQDHFAEYIIGQETNLQLILVSMLSRGHVLLEGLPGVGKTFTVKVLSRLLGVDYSRIQFTPDLLPTDILGYFFYNKDTSSLSFRKGPIFSNIILADEINRTPPKTQAALLEAMEEYQVSIEGKSYPLQEPFFVLATQNHIELSGTYNLPEAQLDRFMVMIKIKYPTIEDEKKILMNILKGRAGKRFDINTVQSVTNRIEFESIQKQLSSITVKDDIVDYVLRLVANIRKHRHTVYGPSPRAASHLIELARGWALKDERDYVIPDDIKFLSKYALSHRIIISAEAQMENISKEDIIEDIINKEDVPR